MEGIAQKDLLKVKNIIMKKEKIHHLLWTFVLLLLIVGCNKDDSNNPDPVNNIPSDFEITVSDITPYTAMLSWTVPLTDEPTTIKYSIYLNESLLAESLTDTVFTLSELNENTPYTVKIKAKNEFGEKGATNNFTTLPQRKLLLKEYIYPNHKVFKIEYNEDRQISLKYFAQYPYLNTEYTYIDGKISTDLYNHNNEWGNAIYTYNTDQRLTHLKTNESFRFWFINCKYDFESNTEYNYEHTTNITGQVRIRNFSVNLTLNDDGNIVKYERLDLDTSRLDTATFEYTNGNMTKIKSISGAIWEISYDDKMSFHTYASGFPSDIVMAEIDTAGLLYHDELHLETRDIPHFYRFQNKNNPLEYKVNFAVKTTFEYEYNIDKYPSSLKANFDDGTNTGVIQLTYEEQ